MNTTTMSANNIGKEEAIIEIDVNEFIFQKKWLETQCGILTPSGSDSLRAPEGLLNLMDAIQDNLEKIGVFFGFNHTDEVTEYCSNCEHEVTLKWDMETDGIRAFCPHCGNRLMLCDMCPVHNYCDYDLKTDSCRFSGKVRNKDLKIAIRPVEHETTKK